MPTPIYRIDFTAYLDALQAYNLNLGVDSMLRQARMICNSHNYYYYGFAFPTSSDITFTPRATMEDTLSIPAGSYILSMGGAYIADDRGDDGKGFKFGIYDKGSGIYLFEKTFGKDVTVLGDPSTRVGNRPFGLHYLVDPLIMVKPGQLQIEMTSLNTVDNARCQMLLNCAVPIRDSTMNTPKMKTQDIQELANLASMVGVL